MILVWRQEVFSSTCTLRVLMKGIPSALEGLRVHRCEPESFTLGFGVMFVSWT